MWLVLFFLVPSASAASFSDVPAANRFYEDIEQLAERGIITGFPDGTFQPKQTVTRGQAAIFLGRALGLDGTKRPTSFSDVAAGNTASGYIESAVELGVIAGLPDGTYRPNDAVTRGQAAILLGRAYALTERVTIGFSDVSKQSVTYPFIENTVAAGIAYGYGDGRFLPGAAVVREQFAAFLNRAEQYEPPAESLDWHDFFLPDSSLASFKGDGNEYAAYTARTVWHDDRHVTVYEDNGGTVMARTYRLEENRVVIVREEGEQYTDYTPSEAQLNALEPLSIYLEAPLEEGRTFDGWTVVDDAAVVVTPLRAFNNVIVIERESEGAVIRSYFARGYGEIKQSFEMDSFTVTSVIESLEE